jgi:hypothetical protein
MTTTKFKPQDKVRIKSERGTRYRVIEYGTDGSVKLYGGSQNPNGWRGVKSVPEDQLVLAPKK